MKNHHRKVLPSLFIAVALCLVSSGTARASSNSRSIVGLWDVHYFSGTTEAFQGYVQWHNDGLEFEVGSLYPGLVCQGVYQEGFNGKVRDFHVVFTFDSNGKLNGHIEEEINVVVDPDADEYHGTRNSKFFDLNGKQVGQGSLTVKATKIKLH